MREFVLRVLRGGIPRFTFDHEANVGLSGRGKFENLGLLVAIFLSAPSRPCDRHNFANDLIGHTHKRQ